MPNDHSSHACDTPRAAAARRAGWLPLALVIAFVTLLYLPIRTFGYCIIDDASNVYANRFLCHLDAQNLGYLWKHPYYDLYMPLTDTIWALLAHVAPLATPLVLIRDDEATLLNPAVFHAASLCFHVAATAIVFAILRRLKLRPWACAAGALMFGAHPLQVQAVAWITGFNNLTGAFFGLLAFQAYLVAAAEPQHGQAPSRAARGIAMALSTLCFVAALLSKPSTTALPLFVVAIEVIVLRRPVRNWAAPMGFWALLALICIQVTRSASNDATFSGVSPIWSRPFIGGDALAFYMGKVLLPYDLSFDYSRNPHAVLSHGWGYFTWLLPFAAAVGFYVLLHRSPKFSAPAIRTIRLVLAGFVIFVAGLLPTLGFVPFYSETVSTVSDRYAYLAMFGLSISVAALLSDWRPRNRLYVLIPVVVLGAYGSLTALQVPIWANMNSFTNDLLASTPNSPIAHQCYGMILSRAGNWGGAYDEFRKAEQLQIGVSGSVQDDIGQCLYFLGRYDEAIAHYEKAIRLQPDDNEGWFLLWTLFTARNRLQEAEAYYRERIREFPNDDRAKFTLGLVLMQRNRPADALPYVELGAKNDPESADNQFYVGVVLQKLGRFREAAAYYERALRLNPGYADARKALASLPAGSALP